MAEEMSQAASPTSNVSDRDKRALTETMTVNYWDDPGVYDHQVAVYSSHKEGGKWVTERYAVNPSAGICDCGDMVHRRPTEGCKHIRRVRFEMGERLIPPAIDTETLADGIKRPTREVATDF